MHAPVVATVRKTVTLTAALLCVTLFSAFPDDGKPSSTGETVVSQLEEWRQTLKFGIDSQVIDILETMKADKDERLSDEILAVFSTTRNTKVREASLRYFTELSNPKAESVVLDILDSYEDHPTQVLLTALDYLGKIKSTSLPEKAMSLIRNQNKGVASAAIRAVGSAGDGSYAEKLLPILDEEDFDVNLKGDIILALGDLKAETAISKITSILEDTDSEAVWRRYSCVALGKIGKPESLVDIIDAYEKSDPQKDTLFRTYAVNGAAEFAGDAVVNFLIDVLRDSYWKVRISAIQGLSKRKSVSAVPVLIYKARLDPETNVKIESLKALSEIGTPEAVAYLLEVMNNKKSPAVLRENAVTLLVDKHLDACREPVDRILTDEWNVKDSRLLDIVGKLLSQKEEPGLDRYYERFLGHTALTMKIYGIRGIERNHLSQFRERIVELSADTSPAVVRKAALAALEKL